MTCAGAFKKGTAAKTRFEVWRPTAERTENHGAETASPSPLRGLAFGVATPGFPRRQSLYWVTVAVAKEANPKAGADQVVKYAPDTVVVWVPSSDVLWPRREN
jgi:hypothetical protein